jgi:protein TonB
MSRTPLIVISVAAHLGLGIGLGSIQPPRSHAATAIEIANVPKKKPDVKPPEPAKVDPEPPKKAQPREARKVAAPPVAENTPPPPPRPAPPPGAEAHDAADALPDFGLSLSGGVGGDGVAIPQGRPGGSDAPKSRGNAPVKKTLAASPQLPGSGDCEEPPVKPKAGAVQQPAYSTTARAAGIEGKVRLKITVDENGNVVDVAVVAGLGYGLDEAAIAAAKATHFEAGTQCGKKIRSTFNMSFRFSASQ